MANHLWLLPSGGGSSWLEHKQLGMHVLRERVDFLYAPSPVMSTMVQDTGMSSTANPVMEGYMADTVMSTVAVATQPVGRGLSTVPSVPVP